MENIYYRKYKKQFKRYSPFLLLGNEIDGKILCEKKYDFRSYSELKKRIPKILTEIEGEGEWVFELYQVENDYRIWHRWGYYRYPNKGRKIFKYDYCDLPLREVIFARKEILLIGSAFSCDNYPNRTFDISIQKIKWNWMN